MDALTCELWWDKLCGEFQTKSYADFYSIFFLEKTPIRLAEAFFFEIPPQKKTIRKNKKATRQSTLRPIMLYLLLRVCPL